MRRFAILTTVVTAVLVLVLPFVGGGGPSLASVSTSAYAADSSLPVFATTPSIRATTVAGVASVSSVAALERTAAAVDASLTVDTEHLAQKPVPVPVVVAPSAPSSSKARGSATGTAERKAAAAAAGVACAPSPGGGGSAPSTSAQGIAGTSTADIQAFSALYNSIRAANCLQPIAPSHFRYDACMEQRLFWMAEDPSADPGNTWGHMGVHSIAPAADGSYYSDINPSVGCDGNLAGGSGNSGATVAQKWWDSAPHRTSLYRPTFTGSTANVCIYFAMTHGGLPNDGSGFARAAARWGSC